MKADLKVRAIESPWTASFSRGCPQGEGDLSWRSEAARRTRPPHPPGDADPHRRSRPLRHSSRVPGRGQDPGTGVLQMRRRRRPHSGLLIERGAPSPGAFPREAAEPPPGGGTAGRKGPAETLSWRKTSPGSGEKIGLSSTRARPLRVRDSRNLRGGNGPGGDGGEVPAPGTGQHQGGLRRHRQGGEAFLVDSHIPPYVLRQYPQPRAEAQEEAPSQGKREIRRLGEQDWRRRGLTLVPLRIYFRQAGWPRWNWRLARGKKTHDKRETIKPAGGGARDGTGRWGARVR